MMLASGSITAVNANPATGTATAGSTVGLNGNGAQTPVAIYSVNASQMRTLAIQVTGTFVATLTVQESVDGVNWVANGVVAPITTGTPAGTITAVGVYTCIISGCVLARLTCTAFTSGTAVVTLNATTN